MGGGEQQKEEGAQGEACSSSSASCCEACGFCASASEASCSVFRAAWRTGCYAQNSCSISTSFRGPSQPPGAACASRAGPAPSAQKGHA